MRSHFIHKITKMAKYTSLEDFSTPAWLARTLFLMWIHTYGDTGMKENVQCKHADN